MPKGKSSKPRPAKRATRTAEPTQAEPYTHPTETAASRPEVGTQAQFKKKKPAKTYEFDSSLELGRQFDAARRKVSEPVLAEPSAPPVPDAIAAARAFGVDVTLIEEALRLTPTQRLARLQGNVDTIRSAKKIPGKPKRRP